MNHDFIKETSYLLNEIDKLYLKLKRKYNIIYYKLSVLYFNYTNYENKYII